jgi:hypothetical protein
LLAHDITGKTHLSRRAGVVPSSEVVRIASSNRWSLRPGRQELFYRSDRAQENGPRQPELGPRERSLKIPRATRRFTCGLQFQLTVAGRVPGNNYIGHPNYLAPQHLLASAILRRRSRLFGSPGQSSQARTPLGATGADDLPEGVGRRCDQRSIEAMTLSLWLKSRMGLVEADLPARLLPMDFRLMTYCFRRLGLRRCYLEIAL